MSFKLPKNAKLIFEHQEHSDDWFYEDFFVYTIEGKSGFGYYHAVPYSEVTCDANDDQAFIPNVDWETFKRMHLTQDLRDILGSFTP